MALQAGEDPKGRFSEPVTYPATGGTSGGVTPMLALLHARGEVTRSLPMRSVAILKVTTPRFVRCITLIPMPCTYTFAPVSLPTRTSSRFTFPSARIAFVLTTSLTQRGGAGGGCGAGGCG